MSLTNFPNGITSFGVPVLPTFADIMTSGKIFWVDSNGSGAVKGGYDTPFRTLNAAVGKCIADRGDLIMVKEGHVEDLADTSSSGAIDLDVAGITILGMGNGSLMPRIDLNHADSDFIFGANNIRMSGIHLRSTITLVALGIAIEAAVTGSIIEKCKLSVETTTTDEFLISINLLAGCDNTIIRNNYIDNGLGGAAAGVKLVGASDDVRIYGNIIKGDYSIANISGITTLSTEVDIASNMLINGASGNLNALPVIEMLTNTTGYVRDNTFFCNVATIAAMTVADAMIFSNNMASEDTGAAAGAVLRTGAVSVTASADD